MRRLIIIALATAAALCVLPRLTAQTDGGFQLVAHPDQAGTSLSRKDVSNLFLKKRSSWPDGTAAEPIDQLPRSQIRAAFSREVHRRDVASILRFWQRRVFSGTETPPPEAKNDEEVLAFVREHPGGIGYVSTSASTGGVAVLDMTDSGEE